MCVSRVESFVIVVFEELRYNLSLVGSIATSLRELVQSRQRSSRLCFRRGCRRPLLLHLPAACVSRLVANDNVSRFLLHDPRKIFGASRLRVGYFNGLYDSSNGRLARLRD